MNHDRRRWRSALQHQFDPGDVQFAPGLPARLEARIFRAIVWGITKDFSAASKMAGTSGKLVAYGMIVYGAGLR